LKISYLVLLKMGNARV